MYVLRRACLHAHTLTRIPPKQGLDQVVQFEIDNLAWSRNNTSRKYWKLKLVVGGFQMVFGAPITGQNFEEDHPADCLLYQDPADNCTVRRVLVFPVRVAVHMV